MKNTLEGSRIFPYIAWGTIFLFTLLTFLLVLRLQASIERLELQTQQNVTALTKPN